MPNVKIWGKLTLSICSSLMTISKAYMYSNNIAKIMTHYFSNDHSSRITGLFQQTIQINSQKTNDKLKRVMQNSQPFGGAIPGLPLFHGFSSFPREIAVLLEFISKENAIMTCILQEVSQFVVLSGTQKRKINLTQQILIYCQLLLRFREDEAFQDKRWIL